MKTQDSNTRKCSLDSVCFSCCLPYLSVRLFCLSFFVRSFLPAFFFAYHLASTHLSLSLRRSYCVYVNVKISFIHSFRCSAHASISIGSACLRVPLCMSVCALYSTWHWHFITHTLFIQHFVRSEVGPHRAYEKKIIRQTELSIVLQLNSNTCEPQEPNVTV